MRQIIKVKPGDTDFHLFENLPKHIYPSDSYYFKTNESINTELLEQCYILLDSENILARAALYNNPLLKYENKTSFCIGNYESVDDLSASNFLLQHISKEAKNKGAEFLIGPMNGNTSNNYRFSTHHQYPNFFLEPYHHLYYNSQFLNAGFQVIANYFSSIGEVLASNPAIIKRENEIYNLGVTFRNIDTDNVEAELEKLYQLNSIAFKTNFLYTPISKDSFIKKYAQITKIIDPEFVILAENKKQQPIGYLFCIKDFYNTKVNSLIVKTAARHPAIKWSGLGHVMANIIFTKALEQNYQSIIHAFIYEGGTSLRITKDFEGTAYKNYALYGKQL